MTPHIGLRVEDNERPILQQIEPGARRRLDISSRRGRRSCRACARPRTTPGGTSTPVFEGFPITVAGKTGTAERGAQGDQSWYVVAAPYDDPRVVVAVTIERGGFGAEAAPRAARRILAAYFGIKGKKAVGTAGEAPGLMAGQTQAALPSGPACSASPSRAPGSCGSTSCCCSATLGLIAFSLVTLDTATATDIPGSPDYFVIARPCTRSSA